MVLAFSYQRFSTVEQRKGDSIRRQTALRDAWLARNPNVTLDTSVTYADCGVSARKGIHRSNPDRYAFAAFLEACELGKIPPGSFLVVESLDRLTREHLRSAVNLVWSILDHKVNVVTLSPEKVYAHDKSEMFDIIQMIFELARGFGESELKSVRVGQAWANKQALASTKPVTSVCPKWLELRKGKFVAIPERVEVVQQIFRLCIEGYGIPTIAKTLNSQGEKSFMGKVWQFGTIHNILKQRTVIGEYQAERKHIPIGDPVPNYFPVVISEGEFERAQLALSSRRQTGGAKRAAAGNLFTSLVFDSVDGSKWRVETKGRGLRYMANSTAAIDNRKRKAVPYHLFEEVVLRTLREVTVSDIAAKDNNLEAQNLVNVDGKIAIATNRMSEIQDRLAESAESVSVLLPVLLSLEKAKKELILEREAIRRSISTPVVESLSDAHTLLDLLAKASGDELTELRNKLRAKISAVVSKITITHSKSREGIHITLGFTFRNADYKRVVPVLIKQKSNLPSVIKSYEGRKKTA
jgi:DNA invertase Pin-like site-specific DNA recombinase